ncbi:alpha/beta hydrolase [Mycolicibacterium brumae]|uniref:Alpha/beta hydrolase n=1 Tax=Mycolicibacterium brumae TaxID=85968 RepID=A0A2G5PAV7_9MYCO|nr:alpha/beta hydrolase [Mycolicibacterium brumae]MCV7192966.1 alpha/beta hydrolase [Mycolicibacterium brumae]PIB75200.1 alpha/beta hydrolase [Mycolicibacterium brumae]RWA23555.1 hypothetical protein MBRU_01640 [Mycolicibacterium brumae DSM 44177]UWW08516.1 alpha/beta hydrolase family protein [Mycolicibacterium brumae]
MTRPTVSQARGWQPDSLLDAARAWDTAAADTHREVAVAVRGVDSSGDFWRGSAADAARDSAGALTAEVSRLARAFVAAAAAARSGAALIGRFRDAVLTAVSSAGDEGLTVADDGAVTGTAEQSSRAAELTVTVRAALDQLGIADDDTARDLEAAFVLTDPAPTRTAGWPAGPQTMVASWPSTGQDEIAEQIAALTPLQRQQLVEAAPLQVGNTDGVPWDLRIAANRINIADAILTARAELGRSEDQKVAAELAASMPKSGVDAATHERLRMLFARDPNVRAGAVAAQDRKTGERVDFYQGLLAEVADPTGRSELTVARQFIGFDPERQSLIELHGDLNTATGLGVLVPGLNTRMQDSAANTETVVRFTRAGAGKLAMITYLGGPFPTGADIVSGLRQAADPGYAERMAPRLAAFSEDVDRTVDATGRDIPVTYLGHSYGGSILGTAEKHGLTADRVVYVEAAGAGVGVLSPADWHNRNPKVQRYSMTAPGDWIEAVQGFPFGPHGADPDTMPGVLPLPTGRRANGWPMFGPSTHSDVVNEPSDAWSNLLKVMLARRR